jgi:exodeoxyribonuclease-3
MATGGGMKLRVASWNVNSIRSRLEHVLAWMDAREPDILLLQETKVEDSLFPVEPFAERGLHVRAMGQKALNGVAVISRTETVVLGRGLSSGFLPDQKRALRVGTSGITIMDVYVPNGGDPSLDRFKDKLAFLEHLAGEIDTLPEGTHFLVAGDFNVAPGDDDVVDPAAMEGHICFHPEERTRFRALLDKGLVDLFRAFNPAGKAFSWWDYREASYRRNIGMRLDHMLVTPGLAAMAESCAIDREPRGWIKPSDHAPLVADFVLPDRE